MRTLACVCPAWREIWTLSLLRDIFREFLGTTLFLLLGIASTIWPSGNMRDSVTLDAELTTPHVNALLSPPSPCQLSSLPVSLAFGAALVTVCVSMGPTVQLNPAVTLALGLGLRLGPIRALLLVGAQLLGALSACAFLQGIVPKPMQGQLGINEVAPGVHLYQAVSVETAVTFQLVLCVLAVSRCFLLSSSSSPAVSSTHILGPIALGVSVMLGHLTAIGYTGCGMNPARSFGPAVVQGHFHGHWVYWVGPCAGAMLAWFVHDVLLWPRWSSGSDWLAEFKELLRTTTHKPDDPEHTIGLERDS